MTLNLAETTNDWWLPNQHEKVWWEKFQNKGRTFLDIGAHVGTWTLNIGRNFDRVFCFEPDVRAASTLAENLHRAGMDYVKIVQCVVGDKPGMVNLSLYTNPCTNTLFPVETGRGYGAGDNVTAVQAVEMVTIDEFCKEHGIDDVDLIKVDTEGAECKVIFGGLETWRKCRPDFFVELHGPFHRECRKLLDFEECDLIDTGAWGFSMIRHRATWDMGEHAFTRYPHGVDATDEDLLKIGGRERWIQFKAIMP